MNLFVGNLSPETREDDLRQIFSEFGKVLSTKVVIDNATGLPRGFGFVEIEEKFDAFDAIDNIDMTYFMGQIITVKEAKPKVQPGGGGGGRSFNPRGGSQGQGGGGNRFSGGGSSGNRFTGGGTGGGYRDRDSNSNDGFKKRF
jgi:cold-inducible RNA-binding protein